mmetsp:Transcript_12807/g.32271  ORF Transcript_12807/g.32271 Transcript_12807/m.32271 type:complete len:604 (-) Transcript_12807:181-1992(-)
MKSFGPILLFIAALTNTVFGKSNLYTGWTPKLDGVAYESLTAQVGDTITFIWPTEQIQNIFIHPTNDCTQTGRIAVGNLSPTEYTFKEEDGAPGGKNIFFANDVSDMCENYGMSLIVTVFPADDSGGEIPVILTEVVTSSPTAPPTLPPTPFPTLPPVAPTSPPVDPTAFPTFLPTSWPTRLPTPPPTLPPTNDPTAAPVPDATPPPTLPPTLPPTESANTSLERRALRGLQMTLSGMDSFSDASKDAWVAETEAHCTVFYENDYDGSSFRTSIAVTNSFVTSDQKRSIRGRNLQSSSVIITYNQVVSFSGTGDAEITDDYLAKAPFATAEEVGSYVGTLNAYAVLGSVTDISPVTFADEVVVPTAAPVVVVPPTAAPTKQQEQDDKELEKGGLSLAVIIGIACGGGALLIIAVLFFIYCRGGKAKELEESSPPPNVSIKPDEVSTLAGPEVDRSIGTVDYDYSKAYNDKDHSISYAGGTLGSDTQDFSFPANAGATGAALGPYDDGFDGFGKGKFKEEILHIFAPPGKLGVVIDTPDDGAPVVHAVKETSVVVNKVKVGDKLVAVDDEDVRTLTAIKVSKLISRKSANPSRKLTVLRKTPVA